MREIIFDTETTGLDNREDRVIEIGGIELENQFPTGRTIHIYIIRGSARFTRKRWPSTVSPTSS